MNFFSKSTNAPKRQNLSFAVTSLLGVLGFGATAYSTDWTTDQLLKQKPTVTYQELSDYLSRSTNGFITALPLTSTTFPSNLSFNVNTYEKSFESTSLQDPDALDLQFSFDVEGFTKYMNQPDFLHAKIAYYQTLPFDSILQTYARNYLYPNDWKDVFFPPQHELALAPQQYDQLFVDRSQLPQQSNYYNADWHKGVDNATNTELTFGNEVQLLENGLSHDKKLELIRASRKSIYIGVMTFDCSPNSMELLNALAQRVQAGVDVRLMMEGVWTELAYEGCKKKMEDAGIEVVLANDLLKIGDQQDLFHNKIWVFDENEGIMGGENIVPSDGASTGFNHNNRDLDVHVKGPAVTEMMQAYVNLYDRYVNTKSEKKNHRGLDTLRAAISRRTSEEHANHQRGQENYEVILNNPATRSKGVCRFAIQGPEGDGNRHRVSQVYTSYIQQAQQSLYLTTPKIDFEENNPKNPKGNTMIWNAVMERGRNGVHVDAISSGVDAETGAVGTSLRGYADKLQAKGHFVEANLIRNLSLTFGTFMSKGDRHYLQAIGRIPTIRPWAFFQYYHGKTITFDRIAMAVGSFNLEAYSAEHSHESTLICQDDALLVQQDGNILRDLVNSVPVTQN